MRYFFLIEYNDENNYHIQNNKYMLKIYFILQIYITENMFSLFLIFVNNNKMFDNKLAKYTEIQGDYT